MNFIHKLEHYWQKPFCYLPLVVFIAAATPLTFAPYYHFWLMPLLFGALIRLVELKPNSAVATAYLFGLVSYTTQFYWIHTALHDVSGLPNLYALPLTLLLPAFLALYPALCFALWRQFRLPRLLKTGIVLPVLWTLTEFARERLLTGFGWGALGYSQITPNSPLAGFAPLGGIHLITLATALTAAWLVLLIDNTVRKQRFYALAVLAAILTSGYAAQQTNFTQPDGSSSTVALVQGNIAQTLKWNQEQLLPTIEKYYRLAGSTQADIVVLPETAIPLMRQDLPPEILNAFAEQAQQNSSALAMGISQYTSDGKNYENAVITLNTPQPDAYYSKSHLVPFGEYKPLPTLTEPLYRLMNMPLADFQSGSQQQAPLQMKNQKVAFNICYEDGFGDELITSAKQSSLLANVSNMAWYGKSNAMFQQLQQSQARAMELGRYMIRSTNTGATAIITPKGNIAALSQTDTETVLEGNIQGYQGETPYMKLGGSLPLILLLSMVVVGLFIYSKRYNTI